MYSGIALALGDQRSATGRPPTCARAEERVAPCPRTSSVSRPSSCIVSVDAGSHAMDGPGRVVRTSKTAWACSALGQQLQELLGAGVDPVHVLDHQHDRRSLAFAGRAPRRGDRSSSLSSCAPCEADRRNSGGADAPRKWARRIEGSSPRGRALQPLGDALSDFLGRHPLREAEVSAVQLHDRPISHRVPVGCARRLELQVAVRIEAAQELVQEARLANAGVAGDQDDASGAIARASERRREPLPLGSATHERGQPALPGDLEPGAAADLARHARSRAPARSCP